MFEHSVTFPRKFATKYIYAVHVVYVQYKHSAARPMYIYCYVGSLRQTFFLFYLLYKITTSYQNTFIFTIIYPMLQNGYCSIMF